MYTVCVCTVGSCVYVTQMRVTKKIGISSFFDKRHRSVLNLFNVEQRCKITGTKAKTLLLAMCDICFTFENRRAVFINGSYI